MQRVFLALRRAGFLFWMALALLLSVIVGAFASIGRRLSPRDREEDAARASAAVDLEDIAEAMASSDFTMLEKLAERTPGFPNAQDPYLEQSYLHTAAELGSVEVVAWLLERGADPNSYSSAGTWPLTAVFDRPDDEAIAIIDLLVAHGANVNATGILNCTPLHEAAVHGSTGIVRHLLKLGADPCAKTADTEPQTPLGLARKHDQTEIAAILESWSKVQP